eukprot:TRINITY_DN3773_c0_g2_i2.p1 TRINITY_DN3773_c0_g2~~TRINITY_DN3773_c0_g2_i2.p1  ORF type:complete len:432 (-),score=81.97 TRINITY_DN3773_c0_g2_i2:323-1618(-)
MAEIQERETQLNRREREIEEKEKEIATTRADLERKQSELNEKEIEMAQRLATLTSKERQLEDTNASVGMFRLSALLRVTNNFDSESIVGRGSFGAVYKGVLNNAEVAVKRMEKEDGKDAIKEFMQEIAVLGNCRHASIVPLIGFCIDRKERCLVFPLMKGGTLQERLRQRDRKLPWQKRMKIAIQIAEGLAYLHRFGENGILHRDVKSANILLDEYDNCKLSDAGLAKFATSVGSNLGASMTVDGRLMGTPGYIDPAFINTGNYTAKSDVYSFGVVMLELLTSKRAIQGEGENLVDLVQYELMGDSSRAVFVADAECGWPNNVAVAMGRIALNCVGPSRNRPEASETVENLLEVRTNAAPDPVIGNDPKKKKCFVCMVQERCCMFLPCRHCATCVDCSNEILGIGGNSRCPLCYAKIRDIEEGDFYQTLVM